jgi:hypothetical protein
MQNPVCSPIKTELEEYTIALKILHCLEGVNLTQANRILRDVAPHLLASAHVVQGEAINRLETSAQQQISFV